MSAKRPLRRPTLAGTLLEQLIAGWGATEKLEQYRVWQVWPEVVGPQIAAHTTPLRIRNHLLEIRVDQAVWMQQLQLLKPKIVSAINQHLGGAPVRDIFWRQGRLPAPPEPPVDLTPPELPPLAAASAAQIETLLTKISSDEVRSSLRHLLQKQARLAAWRQRQASDDSSAE